MQVIEQLLDALQMDPDEILGFVLAIVASLVLGNLIAKWTQAYRTARQKSDTEKVRKESEELNRKANAENDRLKEIEGR